jgi:hypothetical protein
MRRADIDPEAAEAEALAAAVTAARADRRGVPHDEMRQWLLRVSDGGLEATPPTARAL